jgi:hypothetical protein
MTVLVIGLTAFYRLFENLVTTFAALFDNLRRFKTTFYAQFVFVRYAVQTLSREVRPFPGGKSHS